MPIDSWMLIKAGVFARQQSIDEKRRNFVERNAQPVRASETAVNFSVEIEDGVALRHGPDFFHVEARSPRAVKKKQGQTDSGDEDEERDLPTVTKKFTALFPTRSEPGQKFHGAGIAI